MAARLGIKSIIQDNLTIALGSSEVSLIELTSAYSAFDNEGKHAEPYGIAEISSGDGRSLYVHAPISTQAVSPDTAHAMTYMLHRVTTSGTGSRAAPGDRPVAGKTGTTQTNRDAWFVGYSGNEIVGVWFGNDDNVSMGKISGGNFSTLAWRDYMRAANAGLHPVLLAGADDWRPPQARLETKSKGFFNQLADLFGIAPRIEEQEAPQPEDELPWGNGFRQGGSNLGRGR
jgi:penicillin-binding protein 1A